VLVTVVGRSLGGTACYGSTRNTPPRPQVWINTGDIVLVGLRDFQDGKCDVILKYNPDEARELKAVGELPAEAKINEGESFNEDDRDGVRANSTPSGLRRARGPCLRRCPLKGEKNSTD
jgi:hypothetical protein